MQNRERRSKSRKTMSKMPQCVTQREEESLGKIWYCISQILLSPKYVLLEKTSDINSWLWKAFNASKCPSPRTRMMMISRDANPGPDHHSGGNFGNFIHKEFSHTITILTINNQPSKIIKNTTTTVLWSPTASSNVKEMARTTESWPRQSNCLTRIMG